MVNPGSKHVYYDQVFLFDESAVGANRERFVEAVNTELPTAEDRDWPLLSAGYGKPLYLLPMYQQQIAFGRSGFPFRSPHYTGKADYQKGLCPVAENIEERQIICTEFMRPPATLRDMEDVVAAFRKVYDNRHVLAEMSTVGPQG